MMLLGVAEIVEKREWVFLMVIFLAFRASGTAAVAISDGCTGSDGSGEGLRADSCLARFKGGIIAGGVDYDDGEVWESSLERISLSQITHFLLLSLPKNFRVRSPVTSHKAAICCHLLSNWETK